MLSATSAEEGYPEKRLIDEYVGPGFPGWRSADATLPQEVVVEPGQPTRIEKVILTQQPTEPPETFVREFEVQVATASPEGPWRTIGRWTLDQRLDPQRFVFDAAEARYVKLRVLSNYGGPYASLGEFDAYVLPKGPFGQALRPSSRSQATSPSPSNTPARSAGRRRWPASRRSPVPSPPTACPRSSTVTRSLLSRPAAAADPRPAPRCPGSRGRPRRPSTGRSSAWSAWSTASASRPRSPTPATDRAGCSWSSRAGRVRIVRNGALVATPFLDIARPGARAAASRACSGWPSTRTTRPTGTSTSTTPASRRRRSWSRATVDRRTRTWPTRPASRSCWRSPKPYANHNGGKLAFGPRRLPVRRASATAAAAATREQPRPEPERRCSARSCASTSTGGRGAVRDPGRQPVRRRGRRDEIWAYGLRNPWRFSFDRATGDL